MITVFSNNKEIPVNKVEFSDGAITYKLDELPEKPEYIHISVDPSTKVNLVREEVDMICSCIENFYGDGIIYLNVSLHMDYFPYARADRVFEKGNPSPLFDFLVWLDRKRFKKIEVSDVHNDLIFEEYPVSNLINIPQLQCFKDSLSYDNKKDWDVVIAPDKGAVEKAKTISDYLGVECVFANKVRDVSTGKLTEMNLPDYDFTGKKVLIPDDIFDYGGTLKWLGELLKQAGAKEVDLYVTHLIAPKGLKHLTGVIDKVYCYQTVAGYINKQTVLDFNLGK